MSADLPDFLAVGAVSDAVATMALLIVLGACAVFSILGLFDADATSRTASTLHLDLRKI
jgi:hypothetical protein